MRRRHGIAIVSLVLAGAALAVAPDHAVARADGGAGAVGQQPSEPDDDGTTDATPDGTPVPDQDIIPRPNSGVAPDEAGDRGGALQLLVFVVIVAGVGGIVALIVRESSRNRSPDRSPGGARQT
jgi:hypothetical protein